jgi:hypothetical protein
LIKMKELRCLIIVRERGSYSCENKERGNNVGSTPHPVRHFSPSRTTESVTNDLLHPINTAFATSRFRDLKQPTSNQACQSTGRSNVLSYGLVVSHTSFASLVSPRSRLCATCAIGCKVRKVNTEATLSALCCRTS